MSTTILFEYIGGQFHFDRIKNHSKPVGVAERIFVTHGVFDNIPLIINQT